MVTKLENMPKQITIICLMMLVFNSCIGQSKEKMFIAKYELDNFSQFKGVDMAFRGSDKQGNFVIFGYAPHLINDTAKVGYYVIILDKENYQTIKTELTRTEYYVNADTVKLQQLAQTFMKYKIPRLKVDEQENVFIYLKDFETLALARLENESGMKYPQKWINVKSNWYKPK